MVKNYVNEKENAALEKFAELMIEKIESIANSWEKPWFTKGIGAWPVNLSGREYNGGNAMLLMWMCEKNGWKNPVFGTFDRFAKYNFVFDNDGCQVPARDNDGNKLPRLSVNKGEASLPVFITTFTVINKETKEKIDIQTYREMDIEEMENYKVYPRLHVYNVFNIDQTNMKETRPDIYNELTAKYEDKEPEQKPEMFDFHPMDKIIAENLWICPIKPTYGNDAYYSMSKKIIVVPEKKQFKDGESFYANTFHEMAHSTGAEDQLNRLKPSRFGSAEYAREELIAELSAALTASRYGIVKNIKSNSAAYLKSWLHSLKQEPEFIKTVLNDVRRATGMLTQCIDKYNVTTK